MYRVALRALTLLIIVISTSNQASARGPAASGPTLDREGKSYVAIGTHYNQFKSIKLTLDDESGNPAFTEFPLTATTYGASFTYGTHITDNFFSELRVGQGVISDKLSQDSLEVNLGQWFNWYIGAAYPMTDYGTVFAKYGLSFFNADVTRYETKRTVAPDPENPNAGGTISVTPSSTVMEEKLFDETFSTSWLVGIDFEILQDTFWSFEYGRLLNDSGTGIKVYQLNSLIKYEF